MRGFSQPPTRTPEVRLPSAVEFDRFDDVFRSDANAPVLGELTPPDPPVRANQEFGRSRDVDSAHAATGVEHAVGGNDLCRGIREDRKLQAELVHDSPVVLNRVHGNRDHLGAGGIDVCET